MTSFKECEARGHPLSLTGSGYHWCACAKRKEPTSETRLLFDRVPNYVAKIDGQWVRIEASYDSYHVVGPAEIP